MDLVRGAINPEITFDKVILNEEQSSIVLEPQIKDVEKPPKLDIKPTAPPINVPLFEEISQKSHSKINYLREVKRLSHQIRFAWFVE